MTEKQHRPAQDSDASGWYPYAFLPDLLDRGEREQDAIVITLGAQLLETLDVEHFEWRLSSLIDSGAVADAIETIATLARPTIEKAVRDGLPDETTPAVFPTHVFGAEVESLYRAADRLALAAAKSAIKFRRMISVAFAAQGWNVAPELKASSDRVVSPLAHTFYVGLQRATATMFGVRAAVVQDEELPTWLSRQLMETWLDGTRLYLRLLAGFGIEPALSETSDELRLDLAQADLDDTNGRIAFRIVDEAYAIGTDEREPIERLLLAKPRIGEFLLEARDAIQEEFLPTQRPSLAYILDIDSGGFEQLVVYVPTDKPIVQALQQIRAFQARWWRQNAPDGRVLLDCDVGAKDDGLGPDHVSLD